ncbi:type IVB secretion system protein IcmH/DotU [Siccirubricoccus phaeus]|uniref:type IVB secretion system protein IcmH/DotU n=1 Tax=Siccirubricoccus phaeus TaxID=2595053 RepID=UPI0011F389B6|nr:type IVB secretion system protein IcmH/DotU [Siccirubricoccus phaeus]
MSDDPFAEPEDTDRTVIRPRPGGRAPAPPPMAAPVPTMSASAPIGPMMALPVIGVNPLAAAAAPVMGAAIRLLGRFQHPQPDQLRRSMVEAVREFERRALATGLDTQSLRAARYALCAMIDDMVLSTPWGANSPWSQQSLTSIFHNEVAGGERFFEILKQMEEDPARHGQVVELMYLCLSLGFVGRYRVQQRGVASLTEFRDALYRVIRQRRGEFERDLSVRWQGIPAGHRPLAQRVPLWLIGTLTVFLLACIYLGFNFSLAGDADALAARYAQLPPSAPLLPPRPPGAPPPPPAQPAPPPPPSSALPRLRTFLAPEIQARLVDVLEDSQTITIRVANNNMFALGQATLNAGSVPLLERVARALNDESGAILVTGHTDSSPIRTARFPSNWHLSQARAETVARLVAGKLENPNRVRAEGKADTQPVASNDTREGQQANRRTDIILVKAGDSQ